MKLVEHSSTWNSYLRDLKPEFTPSDLQGVIVSKRRSNRGCVRVQWDDSHVDTIHVDFLYVV